MAKALDGPESSGPSRSRLPDVRAFWPKNNTGIGCVYFLFSSQSLSVLTRGRSCRNARIVPMRISELERVILYGSLFMWSISED
jgi:hypothetical protein